MGRCGVKMGVWGLYLGGGGGVPGLTRHSSSRAGREMMMRSFFTSCVMKATSSDSERS